jgi:hypothetical protein
MALSKYIFVKRKSSLAPGKLEDISMKHMAIFAKFQFLWPSPQPVQISRPFLVRTVLVRNCFFALFSPTDAVPQLVVGNWMENKTRCFFRSLIDFAIKTLPNRGNV